MLTVLYSGPISRASIAAVVDVATGTRVAFTEIALRPGGAHLGRTTVAFGGRMLATFGSAEIGYSLGDLVSGKRAYGISAVAVDGLTVALRRRADGTFDLPGANPSPAAGGRPNAMTRSPAPLRFNLRFRARDARVELLDPSRTYLPSRQLAFAATVAGTIAPDRSEVGATGELFAGGSALGMARLTLSAAADHELAVRLTSSRLIAPPVIDEFIDAPSARCIAGIASNIDLRLYAFANSPLHVGGTFDFAGGALRVPGLRVALRDLRGRFDFSDAGLVTRAASARLGPLDATLDGGLIDLRAPEFRLGATFPNAPLGRLRQLFGFSQGLPLVGQLAMSVLIEGPVGAPAVAVAVRGPSIAYGGVPGTDVLARVIYHEAALSVAPLTLRYGAMHLNVVGRIELGATARSELVGALQGPSASVPYLAEVTPRGTVGAVALAIGDDLRFDVRGDAESIGAASTLAAAFHVDPQGDGRVGPLAYTGPGGARLEGTWYLDRRHGRGAFWLAADRTPYDGDGSAKLPALALAAPAARGRFDVRLIGEGPPNDFRIGGRLGGSDLAIGGLALGRVSATVAGHFGAVRFGNARVDAPWGRLTDGSGSLIGRQLVAHGRYVGTFGSLATLTGPLGGSGPLAGPVAIAVNERETVVQARDVRTFGATVAGVPLDRIAGTFGVRGRKVRVYAALGRVAGGEVAGAGSLDGESTLGVTAADVQTSRLDRVLPLRGRAAVAAVGTSGVAGGRVHFTGGLALGAGSTLDGIAVRSNADIVLRGSTVHFSHAETVAGGALATFDGSIAGLGTRGFRYATDVRLRPSPLQPIALGLFPAEDDVGGTIGATLHVRGDRQGARAAGAIFIPEGTYSGLRFRDAEVDLSVGPDRLDVRAGRLIVGSTTARFTAMRVRDDASLRLMLPHVNLADFNDYFDNGDTLGGAGRISVEFTKHGTGVRTGADIAIAGLRYRRFDLGDAVAAWNSRGGRIVGSLAFGGPSGRLATSGTLALAEGVSLRRMLARSRFVGTATLQGLDLGTWLPALGFAVPLEGRLDASAAVTGALEDPLLTTSATLRAGSVGKIPVDRFVIDATSTLAKTTVTSAELDLPSLKLTASGSFGVAPRAPVALALHATSPNIATVAARLLGPPAVNTFGGLDGSAEADVKVGGRRDRPTISGGFDLEHAHVRGVVVPRALGQFTVAGRDVELTSVEVGFTSGTLFLAGSAPLQIAPLGFGRASAPISLNVTAAHLELADFASLLPPGSQLAGTLDGAFAVGGTAGAPQFNGALALRRGALRTPLETVPLTAIDARVSFVGTRIALDRLAATAGAGTLAASGHADFANSLRVGVPGDAQLDAVAHQLRLNFPAFGSGEIDGNMTFSRVHGERGEIAGNLSARDTTIPFATLLAIGSGGGNGGSFDGAPLPAAVATLPDVGLDLALRADRNVRIRSSNVDIGATGTATLGGTLAAPNLTGEFDSTGGTLTYVNTLFRLVNGRVLFTPDLGLIPTLDARATAHVSDPDPNSVRNFAGTADVTISLTGPVTNLTVGLASDPPYDRQQILGLLLGAPALGASDLFASSGNGVTYFGSTSGSGPAGENVGTRNANAQVSVAQEAFGIANAQFTRTLLAPIESTFAQAVGLSDFNVNVDLGGNVGLTARKFLGKRLDAVYGTSVGYPYRQSFGFEIRPSDATVAQLTVFQTLGATGLTSLAPTTTGIARTRIGASEPTTGSAGFSLSLQRLFR